ncbi:AAA family ATPase [Rheinheimera muenzenbergensis]|uniref:AAA family ATPase n=1 Tax=Rheinheimera muenzenbergensis TaxID=1193628 RepID=A0ABU8C2C4_9GAMM
MDATYKLLTLPNLQGNPLVEALHFLCDPEFQEQVVSGKYQWCPPNYWKLSKIYRVTVLEALNQIHVPAPQMEILYEKIVSHLLNSYSLRNPLRANSNRIKYKLAVALNEKIAAVPAAMTTAPTMLVHGVSGAGKSTTILSILNAIPQVICHQEYEGKPYQQSQLLWISMDLPATPSIKALALNFFRAVDKALGTDEYYTVWSKRNRDSVDQHITGMQLVAQTHELGLVHIDEMQFMKGYAKSKDTPSMTVLEAIFNKLGIPMLLSTTTAGLEIFRADYSANGSADFTIARRMLNDRAIQFKPLTKDSPQYKRFIEALFPRDILLNCTALSEEFIDRFYLLSCGLPAIMLRLAKQHHEILMQRAEKKGADSMSTDDVKLLLSVYKNQFSLIDPALSCLRRGIADEYEKQIPQDWKSTNQKEKMKRRDLDAKAVTPVTNAMFPPSENDDSVVKQPSKLTLGTV